jgi:hypothetical protein
MQEEFVPAQSFWNGGNKFLFHYLTETCLRVTSASAATIVTTPRKEFYCAGTADLWLSE